MKTTALSCAVLTLLSACGGSTSGPTDLTTVDIPFGVEAPRLSTAVAGTQIFIDTDVGAITVPIDPLGAQGTFQTGFDLNDEEYGGAYLSEGEVSRTGIAFFGFNRETPASVQSSGAFYTRTAASTLPQTGEASFTGDYASFLVFDDSDAPADGLAFVGTIALSADFGNQTVNGRITDRTMVNLIGYDEVPGSAVTDVMLSSGTIDETGAFSGTTSGGAFTLTSTDSTVSDGTFEGLFAGDEASEVVGALRIEHVYNSNDFAEIGVFAARH